MLNVYIPRTASRLRLLCITHQQHEHQVASHLAMSRSQFSRVINRQAQASPHQKATLAKLFGVEPEALFDEVDLADIRAAIRKAKAA